MRLVREPIFHFVLLGTALFVLAHVVRRDDASVSSAIVVSAGRIDHLAAAYARTWRRPPTSEELERLIADDVREEVLYREALALGLDRDDTIIRRRLRQKMEFLVETDAAVEPSEDELARYLSQHEDAYRLPARVSFRHVYLDPQRYGDRLPTEIERLRGALDAAPAASDQEGLGDALLLPGAFHDVTARDVSGTFGDAFAARLVELPLGRWEGPVGSGYGVHLVRVDARTPGRNAELDEVRDAVRRDLANARRVAASEALVRRLMERYTVEIEPTHERRVTP